MNKSNWVLKIVVPVVIGIAIVILVKGFNSGSNDTQDKPPHTVFDLTEQEAKISG